MNEIKPKLPTIQASAAQAFWTTIFFTGVEITFLLFFVSQYLQLGAAMQARSWVLLPIILIGLAAAVVGVIQIRRQRMVLGLNLAYFPILGLIIVMTLLYSGRGVTAAFSLGIVAFFIVGWVYPRHTRLWPAIATTVTIGFALTIEAINPAYRTPLGTISTQIGLVIAFVFIILLAVVVIRAAWASNIRVKLTVPFTVLMLLSLGSFSYLTIRSTQTALVAQVGEGFIDEAENQSAQVLSFFLEKVGQLQVLGLSDPLRNLVAARNDSYSGDRQVILAQIQALDAAWIAAADTDALIQDIISLDPAINPATGALHNFLAQFSDHTEVFITDRYGAIVAASGRLSDYYQADEAWWQAAWQNGQGAVYISDPEYDESARVTASLIAVPVIRPDTGEVIGILRSTLVIDSLAGSVAATVIGETGHAVLFDQTGKVIFDPRSDEVNSGELPQAILHEIGALALVDESHYDIYTDQHGQEIILGHAPINTKAATQSGASAALASTETAGATSENENQIITAAGDLGWVSVVRQDTDEALALVTSQIRTTVILTVLLILVVTGVTIGLSQLLIAPLLSLRASAARVAQGDLTTRSSVQSADEIGALAGVFNDMTAQLERTLGALEGQVAERTRALQISTEVSRRLSTILDQGQLVREVVEQLQQALGYYHAHIYLFDSPKENLVMVGGTGDAGRAMLARGHKIPRGRGLVGRAAETRQPVLVSDVSQEPGWLPNPLLPETRAEVAVPIAVGPEVLGVLDVQQAVTGGLTQQDVDLIQSIANQVGIAVQNAQAYSRAQQRAMREERILAINQRIQAAVTIEDVLKTAVSELGQALGAPRSHVELKVGKE